MRAFGLIGLLVGLSGIAAVQSDAPVFKSAQVRQAYERVEAAKNGLRIALERAIAQATSENDEDEAEFLRAHLDVLQGNAPEPAVTPTSARELARAVADKRYDTGSGIIAFEADGSFGHSHRSWAGRKGKWRPTAGNEIEIQTFDGRIWRAAFTVDRQYLLLVLEEGRQPEGGVLRR